MQRSDVVILGRQAPVQFFAVNFDDAPEHGHRELSRKIFYSAVKDWT